MSFYKSTYYQVLGLQPGVSSLEIKRAYRNLVKSYHPDLERKPLTATQKEKVHQRMARLNEAYATLKDRSSRAAYDFLLGVNIDLRSSVGIFAADNEQIRQQYLAHIFNPARRKINQLLRKYKMQLTNLSQDLYDQNLVAELENYSNEIKAALAKISQSMLEHKAPESLSAAELMLKYAIAQAADGLEELQYFCCNYNYDHLITAENLFRESNKLLRQAGVLSKSCFRK